MLNVLRFYEHSLNIFHSPFFEKLVREKRQQFCALKLSLTKKTLCSPCFGCMSPQSYHMNNMFFLFTIYFHRQATYRFFPFSHNVASLHFKYSSHSLMVTIYFFSVFFFIAMRFLSINPV